MKQEVEVVLKFTLEADVKYNKKQIIGFLEGCGIIRKYDKNFPVNIVEHKFISIKEEKEIYNNQ